VEEKQGLSLAATNKMQPDISDSHSVVPKDLLATQIGSENAISLYRDVSYGGGV
jgi:hypothetical protein